MTTGKDIEYKYGLSLSIDATAQLVLSQSTGQYIMHGVSYGSLEIMRLIVENSGISFEDIVKKYLNTYRKMAIAHSV